MEGWDPQAQILKDSGDAVKDQALDKVKEAGLDKVGEAMGLEDSGGVLLNTINGGLALKSLAQGDTVEAGKQTVELVAGSLTGSWAWPWREGRWSASWPRTA